MEGPTYVLDTNVFIEAAKNYYAFEFGTRFWECLIAQAENGRIQSIDRVKQELRRHDVKTWAHEHFLHAFASTDAEDVIKAYKAVANWVRDQARFSPHYVSEFMNGADEWLVAYANVKRCTLVTHEQPAPEAKKVKIPDVCHEFDVPFIDTFAMLRQLGVRLA